MLLFLNIHILCFLILPPWIAGGSSPDHYYTPQDAIALNCGSSSNSTAEDGRTWIGELDSPIIGFQGSSIDSVSSVTIDRSLSLESTPYRSARISQTTFRYIFFVEPGQKLIRLHFLPASYEEEGFEKSKALFSVRSGSYTLLDNFSPSFTADFLGIKTVIKEFCLNVRDNQPLTISFIPVRSSYSDKVYAFVNGIEVVHMPDWLYYTRTELGDAAAWPLIVGRDDRLPIGLTTAMEMVYRLNVGGWSVSPAHDTGGLFREWSADFKYLLQSNNIVMIKTQMINNITSPNTAPPIVYQTWWSRKKHDDQEEFPFAWKLPVDVGFNYLIRLHFGELDDVEGKELETEREFINILTQEDDQLSWKLIKLWEWDGQEAAIMYKDFIIVMAGRMDENKHHDLLIASSGQSSRYHNLEMDNGYVDTVLKGLEVFKLSNTYNSLAAPQVYPAFPPTQTLKITRIKPMFSPTSRRNKIATCATFFFILLNVIVYHLRVWVENNRNSLPGACRRFSFREIQFATNNFDKALLIGKGGFGKVYRGVVDKETNVAIKRYSSQSKQGLEEFMAEIEVLSMVQHTNIISLIGYCNEGQEMILVYDYIAKGTLADYLYNKKGGNINSDDGNGFPVLSWEQRLRICLGVARALNYLHSGIEKVFIFRDVKSSNILFDGEEDSVAKLTDFGLCKIVDRYDTTDSSGISTDVKGTLGYLDPEYYMTRKLTKESDVYALGVVLWEALSGRPAINHLEDHHHSLTLWASDLFKEGRVVDLIDPSLKGKISTDSIRLYTDIAYRCIDHRPVRRPPMGEVVAHLQCLLTPLAYLEEKEEKEVINQNGAGNERIKDEEATSNSYFSIPSLEIPRIQIEKHTNLGILFLKSFQCVANSFGFITHNTNNGRLEHDSLLEPDIQRLRRFSLQAIIDTTNKFSDQIGRGGYSKVYKGQTTDGTPVAVKVLASLESKAIGPEIKILSQIHHPHIISLLGYCRVESMQGLVLEYMANGSLHDHLHKKRNVHNILSWKKRLEICIGAARGLQYLHSGDMGKKIIHRDIKPANILLDENLVAKISDFGVCNVLSNERTRCSTKRLLGTRGYVDPEYFTNGILSDKSDVYSFGVVLLEVLCARNIFDFPVIRGERGYVVTYFRKCVQQNKIDKFVDPQINSSIDPESLNQFQQIAFKCVDDKGIGRPSMSELVAELEMVLQEQENGFSEI
ncbi:receptor-like protein kinase FERONIA [Impatiens glandulifera]|uniref:receptor-like protein kinase FERONIA n=1 Tax=Impatiens glandulifera TaxID=253017 RepID=UPI001FB1250E|nr:receptor-like protein kinase FERONIA [Impatiens glandulifera]